ncbi:MAG: DUF1667 domain-containing protein [Clostridia bacterium]|nr:DUF1667 domain-containing protein [Clostridia bacterium]
MERKLTCIICPRGCQLTVKFDSEGKISEINGGACKRGPAYAEDECTHPKRTVTSTVRVSGGGLIAVKTSSAIPKELVFDCMREINKAIAKKDVTIGDVIIKNVLDTGSDIVASGEVVK